MNETTMRKLEFDRIKGMTAEFTVSPGGRTLAERMSPSVSLKQISSWLQETEEASALLASGASIPLSAMEGIDPFLSLLGKGRIYVEGELEQLAVWLTSVAQMKKYMRGKAHIAPTIAGYAESMNECQPLRDELNRCIRFGNLLDDASPNLAYIRRHIIGAEDKIERKMNQALNKYRSFLQETVISKRRNRFVLAVKRELRKQVPGTVLDESSSGQTLFVEPNDVAELQLELLEWRSAEERERTVVLAGLSELAASYGSMLTLNVQAMASFDFIAARGKLSRSYNGRRIALSDKPVLKLEGARHPLIGAASMPLDIELGMRWKQLMITGPNTGGKTVALKTMGLLALMTQCGLLIPVERGEIGIFRHIIADLGDGQSLEHSLSTFSSHISVLKEMMDLADERSLLLLDELAAGTDPSEGIALSIAVLEILLEKKSLVAATTHFNEIKIFASRTPGCQNGRMAFDPETLRPLYRLEIGEAGDSHAFAIARRFGLPETVMSRAEQLLEQKKGTRQQYVADQGERATESDEFHREEEVRREEKVLIEKEIVPKITESEKEEQPARSKPKQLLQVGDSVWIYPLKRAGVVFRTADERGNVIVQVKGEKLSFNQKRLKLYIEKEKLYPGQSYDLDIVFESKDNRKARHQMNRKHVEGLQIVTPADE
ncbi:DNA mismatch repair protein MutS [Paenibacillus sp. GCM10027627]|uniref:endonuclease MutS2 n=1 Tax=unclassified Paenibacillus TaxID=185978 RepID=UPI0036318DA3